MLWISIRTLSGLEELQDIKRPMWKSMEEVRIQRAAEHIRKQCGCRFHPPFGRGCGHCAMYWKWLQSIWSMLSSLCSCSWRQTWLVLQAGIVLKQELWWWSPEWHPWMFQICWFSWLNIWWVLYKKLILLCHNSNPFLIVASNYCNIFAKV